MARPINIGSQSFEAIVSKNYFYVDKTKFIKEWWDNDTDVTVITRPRRFGKTLTLDMVKRFFSIQYHGQPEIFKGLAIYKDTNMMEKQGKYPVISLTMADCAMPTFEDMLVQLSSSIRNVFEYVETDLGLEGVRERDIAYIERILEERYDDDGNLLPLSKNMIIDSLSRLSLILYRKYSNTKVIILLDEYDAPLENAYLCGYWDKAAQFFGQFYKKTFKTNLYLGRALITGINVVPMERLSSPFNNYVSYTVTDSMYGDVFGFTQEEVDDAFWEYGLLDLREEAMQWYDGYQFGDVKDMYNPWSISIMLSKKKAAAYWFNTESN